VGNATAASDVDGVQPLLERLKTLTTGQQPYTMANALERCSSQMRYLRDSFDVTPSSDPAKVSRVLAGLTPMHIAGIDFGSDASFDKRVAIVLAPFKKALEDAQNDLDSALTDQKSPERIYATMAAFENASSHLSGASNFRNQMPNNSLSELNAYRMLSSIAGAIQSHHWRRAQSEIGGTRQVESNLQALAGRRPAIHALIEKWTSEIAESEALDARQFHERLHAEFSAVKQPADLGPIIKDLAKDQPDAERDGGDRSSQMLSMRLTALAAAWKNDDVNRLANEALEGGGPEDAAFSEDLAGLRERGERDILSRTLKAPELLQAPLESLPLAKAIDDLLGKLTAAGEWRRALQIMESQAALEQSRGVPPRKMEVMMAVRSYLAGQNFELADLWTDAAAAYKAVLAAALDGAPTQEAADRLKALAKEHPEEVKAARPSPRLDQPRIFRGGAQ
jgi:hypothetical protein